MIPYAYHTAYQGLLAPNSTCRQTQHRAMYTVEQEPLHPGAVVCLSPAVEPLHVF